MLKQEELAFIKALSNFELSPALLRELKKAMAARRRRTKALAPCKDKTYNIAITESHSTGFGAGSEAQPSRKLSQQLAGKRKGYELSSSEGSTVPVTRRPAPGPLCVDGYAELGTTGEPAAGSSRQLCPT